MTITTPHAAPLWTDADGPDAFAGDFYEIQVRSDRGLTYDEIRCLSGCLGYALREVLAGESLSEPTIIFKRGPERQTRATVLEYGYDSTKSCRDDPDFSLAFATACAYIADDLRSAGAAGICFT